MTSPVSWVGNLSSLAELSPFLGAEGFLGKRISLEQYSYRRGMLVCGDSLDWFRLLGFTEIPMVHAVFLGMPAPCKSNKLKPLPAGTLVWYLIVGHLTMGLVGPLGSEACLGLPALCLWISCWPAGWTMWPRAAATSHGNGAPGSYAIRAGHHGCCL